MTYAIQDSLPRFFCNDMWSIPFTVTCFFFIIWVFILCLNTILTCEAWPIRLRTVRTIFSCRQTTSGPVHSWSIQNVNLWTFLDLFKMLIFELFLIFSKWKSMNLSWSIQNVNLWSFLDLFKRLIFVTFLIYSKC